MTQAKINKQKYFLFIFPHRTLFLNYPQYATPLEQPHRATVRTLSYLNFHFLTIHAMPPYISATYKHKKASSIG